jgi:hypothetical protein
MYDPNAEYTYLLYTTFQFQKENKNNIAPCWLRKADYRELFVFWA